MFILNIVTLLEQSPSISPELSSLLKQIKAECSEFLSNPVPLYRGSDADVGLGGRVKIRTNRYPLSSSPFQSFAFDKVFEEAAGVENVRSRSVFCANYDRQTKVYGKTHFVFPTNGTKVMSTNVNDTLDFVISLGNTVVDYWSEHVESEEDRKILQKFLREHAKPGEYYITPAIWNDAISEMSPEGKLAAAGVFKSIARKVTKHYQYSNVNNIVKYPESSEYMLYGADSYFMIPTNTVGSIISTRNHSWDQLFYMICEEINGIEK